MTSKSFFESLEAIANERSLAIEDVLAKVEIAMAVACRDEYNGDIKLDVDFDSLVSLDVDSIFKKYSINLKDHPIIELEADRKN